MTEFVGKVALVTGGGSGIGKSLALALAAVGCRVVVADILLANAEAVANTLQEQGCEAMSVVCDVCEPQSIQAMKVAIGAQFGPVQLLFANAGATSFEHFDQLEPSEIEWMYAVNLGGVSNCVHAFLPDMLAAGEGHVMATSSVAGLIPALVPIHVPYTAAKAGIIGFMLNLREEITPKGIGCTVLCPGGVETNIIDTPRYRPPRFGGPQEAKLTAPADFLATEAPRFEAADVVAQRVLQAVALNRPLVVTDATQKQRFVDLYASRVLQAFDDAAEFDRNNH